MIWNRFVDRRSHSPAAGILVLVVVAFGMPATADGAEAGAGDLSLAGDCEAQIACIKACPQRKGAFGTPQRDRLCVIECLNLSCGTKSPKAVKPPFVVPPVGGKKGPAPGRPDIEMVVDEVPKFRATSEGAFKVRIVARPPGGDFSFDWRAAPNLRGDVSDPSVGLYPMPRGGPGRASAVTVEVLPRAPGAAKFSVAYTVDGRTARRDLALNVLPPILFLHGLASDSGAWTSLAEHLTGGGVTYGGNLCVDCGPPDAGAFFTGTFRDNQGSYLNQGRETARFVTRILALVPANVAPPGRRIVLVGHSMGGLASRAYLQAPYYRDDVAALVTIGTPHQGSLIAQLLYTAGYGAKTPPFMTPKFYTDTIQPLVRAAGAEALKMGVRRFAGKLMHINLDPDSTAVRQLAVVSDHLRHLNRTARFALPKDVTYVSVVGTLPPAMARAVTEDWRVILVRKAKSADPVLDHVLRVFEKTDGLVSAPSQDLNSVKRGIAKVIRTEAVHCCFDGAGADGSSLNETEQIGVIVDALLQTGIVPALPR